MKRKKAIIFVFAVFLMLSVGNLAEYIQASNNDTNLPGAPASEMSDDNIPKPRIVFENRLLDFGKIGPETKPTGEFKFTNTGNSLLEITKVSQCCGIQTSYDKSKYEPGEKGVIKVIYNATTRTGKISRQPIVFSNDPVEPNLVLTVKAEIVNKVAIEPDKLKLFLDEENAKCPKITIKSIDDQPFSIRGIQSTGNCITAQYDPNKSATEFVLDLRVNVAKLEQNMRGDIDIVVTHPQMKIITLPFDVLSRFVLSPALIIALNTEPGVPVKRKIWVFNNYNQEFEIESVSSKNNYITILSEGKVNNGYQFELQITPPPSEGKTNFNDELYIQIKEGERLKIDCNGYYKPS